MKLCDLTDSKTLVACNTDQASLTQPDIGVAQEWALAIARHPADFDGILYPSRFDSGICLALFDKPTFTKLKVRHLFFFKDEPMPCRRFVEEHKIDLV